MTVLADWQIQELAQEVQMIEPFVDHVVTRSPITWFFWAATLLTIVAISRKVREFEKKPQALSEELK